MLDENGTILVRISSKRYETDDICSFEFVSVDGDVLPAFTAGSHVEVHIKDDLTRSYSLCNSPEQSNRYEIAVLKDPKSRGGSLAIHENFKVGDTVRISKPRNNFALESGAKKTVLLAGGIGVTPILSMAEDLVRRDQSFEFHYCARSESKMAYLSRIRNAIFYDKVSLYFDDVPDRNLNIEDVLASPNSDTHIYICGPVGFLEYVRESAKRLNWQDENVHFEYFSADVIKLDSDCEFDVKLANSGKIIRIPADKTVVAVLAEHGVEVPVSCEQGVCGTCQIRVIDGIPDHRDHYLTNDERTRNTVFMPCVSRCKSSCLTLDL